MMRATSLGRGQLRRSRFFGLWEGVPLAVRSSKKFLTELRRGLVFGRIGSAKHFSRAVRVIPGVDLTMGGSHEAASIAYILS
jgi:hypothetical protein